MTLTRMLRPSTVLWFAIIGLAWASPLHAQPVRLECGPAKVHLLELYTSEGCSSCPPAEAWLSGLKDQPDLWRTYVPIAFHVDYWDRLGWRDPFASKEWTARQYRYSEHWNTSSIYTPAFVLDGREYLNRSIPAQASESAGLLKLTVADKGAVTASFQPATSETKPLELHVARLGFGLNIDVRAGENSGRKLQHDFVVFSLDTAKMIEGKAELSPSFSNKRDEPGSRSAIVAWVTRVGEPEALQAVGGWLK